VTDRELEEILTFRWPIVMRRVMADGADEWLQGFVRSVAKHGKSASWHPSEKQEQIIRRLVSELCTEPQSDGQLIEK